MIAGHRADTSLFLPVAGGGRGSCLATLAEAKVSQAFNLRSISMPSGLIFTEQMGELDSSAPTGDEGECRV